MKKADKAPRVSAKPTEESSTIKVDPTLGQEFTCPECGKTFIKTEEHKYRSGKDQYLCSWKCFLARVDRNVRENALKATDTNQKKLKNNKNFAETP